MNIDKQEDFFQASARLLARFVAVEGAEWDLVRSDAKLGREIVFCALAVLFCSGYFVWTIFSTAQGLLGYSFPAAALFAVLSAFCLASIDMHVLIQSRGAADSLRKMGVKVRLLTMIIVAIASFLMSATTFKDDIDRMISEEAAELRAKLEVSPKFGRDFAAASAALDKASQAAARADELAREISSTKVNQARERAESMNECQGNASGNLLRVVGCGPKARGHATAARLLGDEIAAKQDELTRLGNVAEGLELARRRLAEVNAAIDSAVFARVQGKSKRVETLWILVCTKPLALMTVAFWILVGMLADVMMWIALARSVNAAAYKSLREIQDLAFGARLAKYRAEIRRQEAEGHALLEVRTHALAKPQVSGSAPLAMEFPGGGYER